MPDTKTLAYPCPRCGGEDEVQVTVLYDDVGASYVGVLSGWCTRSVLTFCGCTLDEHEVYCLAERAQEDATKHWYPSGAPKAKVET